MFNVCQIYFNITLDALDIKVYTLDTHDANIEHIAYGDNHGKSIHGKNES